MRRATQDSGWFTDGDLFLGIALGFDFCAEHEYGTKPLFKALNMPSPGIGLESRKIGEPPKGLQLVEYTHKPRDRRRKGYPAAVLYLSSMPLNNVGKEHLRWILDDAAFLGEPGDKWHNPQDDVCCAWDERSFAINVRGEENIARLKELKEAFDRADIVAAAPRGMGFLRPGVLAFGILSKFPAETLDTIREQDEAAKRLDDALAATGIEKLAAKNDRPAVIANAFWTDGKPETLRIYLRPHNTRKFQSEWLTVEEAKAWAAGASFMDKTPELEQAQRAAEKRWGSNWGSAIYRGLKTAGIQLSTLFRVALNDQGELIVRLWPTDECAHLLPFGEYRVEDILTKYPAPAEATS